jgi:uncharacterized coiled-coil protein SlyX
MSSGLQVYRKSEGLQGVEMLPVENYTGRVPVDLLKTIGWYLNELGYNHVKFHVDNFHSAYTQLTGREFLDICVFVASGICPLSFGKTIPEIADNLVVLASRLEYPPLLFKSLFSTPMAIAQRMQTSLFLNFLCQKAYQIKVIQNARSRHRVYGAAWSSDSATAKCYRAAAAIFAKARQDGKNVSQIDMEAVKEEYRTQLREVELAPFKPIEVYESEAAHLEKSIAIIKKQMAEQQEKVQKADDYVASLKQKLKEEEDTLRKKRARLGLADDANIEEEKEKLRQEIKELDMKIQDAEMARRDNSNGMQNETDKSILVASDSRNAIALPSQSQNALPDHLRSKWMILESRIVPKLNKAIAKIGMPPICIGEIPANTAEFKKVMKRIAVVVQNADKIVQEQSELSECELSECDSITPSDPSLIELEKTIDVVPPDADQGKNQSLLKEKLEVVDFEIQELLIREEEELAKLAAIRKAKKTADETKKRACGRRLFPDE